jgi:DNA-binding response OmpR family regulator
MVNSSYAAAGSILLLDSDPLTRTILHEALDRAGYLVDVAGDIGVAVDRIRHSRPDLLIVRPYISSMTGAMAAKYLRTRCPGMCVLMVGGLMTDDRIRAQSEVNDFQVFPQPFACDDLLEKVRDVLRSLHARRP